MGGFISRVFLGFASLVCTHAAFIVAHAAGWFPDQQLAGLLMGSPDILQIEAVRWTLTAALAFLLWVAADHFLYRRHARVGPQLASGNNNDRSHKNTQLSVLSEFIPNIKVADSPNTIALFDGAEGDKLIPLLEAEKIVAWGRLMSTSGEPPPLRIPGTTWRTHHLEFHPHRDVIGRKNQTFLKTKTGSGSSYYDVFLNSMQLKRVWPQFEPEYEVRQKQGHPNEEIEWNFDRFGPFIGMSAGPEQQIRIYNFQARGWNRTGDPITNISGYVRSDRTNRRYPIRINDGHGNMIDPKRVKVLPVGQWFDVAAPFGSGSKIITMGEFLREVVPFTFFFVYDGKEIRRTFTLEQIEPRIREYEQLIRQSLMTATKIETTDTPDQA